MAYLLPIFMVISSILVASPGWSHGGNQHVMGTVTFTQAVRVALNAGTRRAQMRSGRLRLPQVHRTYAPLSCAADRHAAAESA